VVVNTIQGFSNSNVTIQISNTPPPLRLQAVPLTGVVGEPFSDLPVATLTVTDPKAKATDFSGDIDWGDNGGGSLIGVAAAGPGTFTILGFRKYPFNYSGTFPVKIRVSDLAGHMATAKTTIKVSPAS
jgi:hypothetical protein